MAKKTAELVPTDQTDLDFIKGVGVGVVGFLKQAAAFFKRANDLEARAKEVHALATTLKAPTNGEEDEEIQKFIKRVAVGKVTVSGHWDGTDLAPGITKIIYRVHRRLTARRDVAIKFLDDSATIGNKLHNAYVAEAKRKADAERERLQKIEDDRARKQREEELVALNKRTKAGREQAAALKEAPLDVTVVDVKPDVVKAAGAVDRTTRKGEVLDAEKFIAAVFEGSLGIPRDVLCIDEVKLNQYARNMEAAVNRWPGVRVVRDTKVV
jgi:hypothetical protein